MKTKYWIKFLVLVGLTMAVTLGSSLSHSRPTYPDWVELDDLGMPTCMRKATPAQEANALEVGEIVWRILESESRKAAAAGKDLKVALIARRGTGLGKSYVMRDTDKNGRVLRMKDIFRDVDKSMLLVDEEDPFAPDFQSELKRKYEDKDRALKFSHMGAMLKNLRSNIDPNIGWKGAHKLKPCYDGKSHIYTEGLGKFYLDTPFEDYKEEEGKKTGRVLATNIVIPKLKYHDKLERLFIGDLKIRDAYWEIPYNLAALPFETDTVNSNQYVLEALGVLDVPDDVIAGWGPNEFRAQAQRRLKATGFRSTKIALAGIHELAPLATAVGGLFGFLEYVNPNHQKYSSKGMVEIVAARAIFEYMQRQDMIEKVIPVYLPADVIKVDRKVPNNSDSNSRAFGDDEDEY